MIAHDISMGCRGPDKIVIRGFHKTQVSSKREVISTKKKSVKVRFLSLIKYSFNISLSLFDVSFDSPCKHQVRITLNEHLR